MTALQVPSSIPALELADFARPLASKADGEDAWKEAREPGATASEIHTLHRAAPRGSTWSRTVHQKLNPDEGWGGNVVSRNGHRLEPQLLDIASEIRGTAIVGNDLVWAHLTRDRDMATPDGFEHDGLTLRGVEVKTHAHGYKAPKTTIFPGVPDAHYSQAQWSMHVFGIDEWVYVAAVTDEALELPIDADPFITVVPRDDGYIAKLVATADDFHAWRDQGCPTEEVSEAILESEARVVDLRLQRVALDADMKRAEDNHRDQILAEHPAALVSGFSHKGDRATVAIARGARSTVLDDVALKAGDPDLAAHIAGLEGALERARKDALSRFYKTKVAASSLRVTFPKGK